MAYVQFNCQFDHLGLNKTSCMQQLAFPKTFWDFRSFENK